MAIASLPYPVRVRPVRAAPASDGYRTAPRPQDMFGHPGMPPFRMQTAPPMPPRVTGPPMPGGGGGGGCRGGAPSGLAHPAVAGARHRPPSLLGFPDMHMMMGMFPPGMLSTSGAVPTINREYRGRTLSRAALDAAVRSALAHSKCSFEVFI